MPLLRLNKFKSNYLFTSVLLVVDGEVVITDFNPDSEVSRMKRIKTWIRKILSKDIL